jgi:hypothetical protein
MNPFPGKEQNFMSMDYFPQVLGYQMIVSRNFPILAPQILSFLSQTVELVTDS